MAPSVSAKRIAAIDGLRGAAILLVTLFHLHWPFGGSVPHLDPWLNLGGVGVSLFFALSGFCLYHPLARAARDGRPWPRWGLFAERRALRILPAYVVSVTIWLFVYHMVTGFPSIGSWWGWPRDLLSHLTFTHTFSPLTFYSVQGVYWSLGTEVQFYLLFPVLAVLCRRSPYAFAAGAVALSGLVAWLTRDAPPVVGASVALCWRWSVLGRLSEFAAGMLAGHLLAGAEGRPVARMAFTAALGVGLLGLLGYPLTGYCYRIGFILLSVSWCGLIVAAVRWERANPFRWGPLAWLGLISYSVYLHNSLVQHAQRVGLPAVVAGLLALLAGAAGYYLVERPALNWREARLKRQPPA